MGDAGSTLEVTGTLKWWAFKTSGTMETLGAWKLQKVCSGPLKDYVWIMLMPSRQRLDAQHFFSKSATGI